MPALTLSLSLSVTLTHTHTIFGAYSLLSSRSFSLSLTLCKAAVVAASGQRPAALHVEVMQCCFCIAIVGVVYVSCVAYDFGAYIQLNYNWCLHHAYAIAIIIKKKPWVWTLIAQLSDRKPVALLAILSTMACITEKENMIDVPIIKYSNTKMAIHWQILYANVLIYVEFIYNIISNYIQSPRNKCATDICIKWFKGKNKNKQWAYVLILHAVHSFNGKNMTLYCWL